MEWFPFHQLRINLDHVGRLEVGAVSLVVKLNGCWVVFDNNGRCLVGQRAFQRADAAEERCNQSLASWRYAFKLLKPFLRLPSARLLACLDDGKRVLLGKLLNRHVGPHGKRCRHLAVHDA